MKHENKRKISKTRKINLGNTCTRNCTRVPRKEKNKKNIRNACTFRSQKINRNKNKHKKRVYDCSYTCFRSQKIKRKEETHVQLLVRAFRDLGVLERVDGGRNMELSGGKCGWGVETRGWGLAGVHHRKSKLKN